MEITPQSKFARIPVLRQTFDFLADYYRQKNIVIGWRKDHSGNQFSPEYLWDRYALDVEAVRIHLMQSTESRLDRHKIIALTEMNILDIQPLTFLGDGFTKKDCFRLNAEYALYFGIQYLTRWNEVYFPGPFYTDKFLLTLLETDLGYCFLQEHIKLLCLKSPLPFPLFWGSQLWFLLEQWGLMYMENESRFSVHSKR